MSRGTSRVQLGRVKRLKEAIVTNIEDDLMLGYDVFLNDGIPVDILFSRGVISIKGQEILCIQKKLRHMRKVLQTMFWCQTIEKQ
ncbi:hypothetical protein DPMN_035567 [Dreissena polymorpha]|uniref:Uncharacterized protein n=1 Tax=Dreissena polymorpha TaxID=45954 RepID=A0A9D4MB80_DREPO|nr:hypothetical protein DPMN_035567 [Dreissena polymorpha]